MNDNKTPIYFPSTLGETISADELDDMEEPELRLSVFLSHAQAPCLRALFAAFEEAEHGTANTPDAPPDADLHKLNKKVAAMAAQLGTLSTAIRQDTAALQSSIAEVKAALATPPQQAAPAPTSYANVVKQTDIANLMEDAARRGAAAHKTAIEEDLRSRSIVVRYFQVAQQPETDLMLAQRLYHSLIVGRLQLGNERIRIESAAWMAGQPGPIRVTFANVASKVKVLQARKLLGGKNAPSLDDLLSPAQLVIKNGLLGSDVAIKARKEGQKVYVRLVHDTPVLFINGQRTEAQAPNKRHKSGRPGPPQLRHHRLRTSRVWMAPGKGTPSRPRGTIGFGHSLYKQAPFHPHVAPCEHDQDARSPGTPRSTFPPIYQPYTPPSPP
eukprot:jgi/Mesvir1/25634/Mv25922-RA.1